MAGFPYVAIVCGLVLSTKSATVATFALAAVQAVAWHAVDYSLTSIVVACTQTVLVGLGVAGLRRMVDLTGELSEARDHLAQLAVTQERLRFARDLHDLLGHSLSLIVLKSELARRLLEQAGSTADYESLVSPIRNIETTGREALTEIRAAVTSYRGEFIPDTSVPWWRRVETLFRPTVTAAPGRFRLPDPAPTRRRRGCCFSLVVMRLDAGLWIAPRWPSENSTSIPGRSCSARLVVFLVDQTVPTADRDGDRVS